MAAAFDVAEEMGVLRAVVNCAGRGGTLRVVDKHGEPGSLDLFEEIVRVNLIGTFNVLRLVLPEWRRTSRSMESAASSF